MIVHYRSLKWPDRLHWHYEASVLGDDEHGTWLWIPPGTILRRGEGDQLTEVVAAWGFVELIHRRAWYSAEFYPDGPTEIYADINTPAVWDGAMVSMVDLDLDVVRNREDGAVVVLDEDEFEEHRIALRYPHHLATAALDTSRALEEALEARTEPFGDTGGEWLKRARQL